MMDSKARFSIFVNFLVNIGLGVFQVDKSFVYSDFGEINDLNHSVLGLTLKKASYGGAGVRCPLDGDKAITLYTTNAYKKMN